MTEAMLWAWLAASVAGFLGVAFWPARKAKGE